MLVFLDTEFTNFAKPELISLALVSEDHQEFYGERTDYSRDACSDFVRETVQPLLGRVPGAACSRSELTDRLRAWFGQLSEPVTLIFDFQGDWLLLSDVLLDRSHRKPPSNIVEQLHLGNSSITHPVFEEAFHNSFTTELPAHHALADARALMEGYRVWREYMSDVWRA